MRKIMNGAELSLGTCYYPEHWDSAVWESDLDRMLQSGIRTIRIAEFAWNKSEPSEGVYDFSFYDSFLDLCDEKGMQVIFCTPTATAPAWLTEKYPEVLNRDINGVPFHHGERQQTNYNSPVYREFSRKITEVTAKHYAQRKCIIGWQLDNEFNCGVNVFYSESDTPAFREFLKKKYKTIEAVNKAWGTEFWNQTYNSFEEVYVPRRTVNNAFNPHLQLDYRRFVADSTAVFAKEQADIIRKYAKPGDFITHNGIFDNTDYKRMLRESLDVLCYDSYPDFAYTQDLYSTKDTFKDRKWSMNLTQTRALSPVFGIMEQQSGPCGWTTGMKAPVPRPGQIGLWTMQSIGHGADYVSYFRWHTCTFGTEMYWHGILDYSGKDNRRLKEIQGIGEELKALKELAGSRFDAKVAVLMDLDNQFDIEIDSWHKDIASASKKALFETLEILHIPFDYLMVEDETSAEEYEKYDLLIYPHPLILNEKRVEALKAYVEKGGKLIFGARSGMKDMNGICVIDDMPGCAKDLTGAVVSEFTGVSPDECPVYMDFGSEKTEAAAFNDILEVTDPNTSVKAVYDSCFYKGLPAVTENPYGQGKVWLYGAAFSESSIRALLKLSEVNAPFEEIIDLPETCELCVREKEGIRYLFILNYMKYSEKITIKTQLYDMLAAENVIGETDIPAYGYRIYRLG